MKKKLFFITALALAITFLTGGISGTISFNEPQQDVFFSGANTAQSEVLANAYNNGVISDRFSYNVLRTLALFNPIEKGGYVVTENMGALALYNQLTNPQYLYVTIEPGLTEDEVAEEIASVFDWSDTEIREFIEISDGLILADEYVFSKYSSPQLIRTEMEMRLKNTIEENFADKYEQINGHMNIHRDQIKTIASIIQNESSRTNDLNLISGILHNQLANNMQLQLDMSLQSRISLGKATLEATFNPEKTNCLFYLHDEYKKTHCSETYDAHRQNIRLLVQ